MPSTAARPGRRASSTFVAALVMVLVGLGIAAGPASAATATLTLSKGSTPIADGGTVTVGDSITARITGFAPNTSVILQFDVQELPQTITTDAAGSGASAFTVPKVDSGIYVMTAIGSTANATTDVLVQNPAAPATVEPAETTSGGSTGGSSTGNDGLAKTGTPSVPVGVSALLLLVVGALFVRLGAAVLVGRHERRPGAHLAS